MYFLFIENIYSVRGKAFIILKELLYYSQSSGIYQSFQNVLCLGLWDFKMHMLKSN